MSMQVPHSRTTCCQNMPDSGTEFLHHIRTVHDLLWQVLTV
jgi:hypothetical protein